MMTPCTPHAPCPTPTLCGLEGGCHVAEAAGPAVAWPRFVSLEHERPTVGAECVLIVNHAGKRFYTVDTWDVQREDPTGMGGPTIETGEGFNDHFDDEVVCWAALPDVNAPASAPEPSALHAHALEECHQLGYTVRDGQLYPPAAGLPVPAREPAPWPEVLLLVNEYASHVADAANHEAASRADIAKSAALRTLGKLRAIYAAGGAR